MTRILHIVPSVPPAVCGIGDYGWLLARELRDVHDILSTFLASGTERTLADGGTEFPVFCLPELTARALMEFLKTRRCEFQAVVLHMSPYGYHKRAVPFWLADGWRQFSALPQRPRLITMFHELYASGSIRSSAFWLQPLQKWVLRTVARASDGLRTNREAYANWLKQIPGLKTDELTVMPVFSNMGEPRCLPSWTERESAMALFAFGIHSGESLDTVVCRAAACCRQIGLERLHLIGSKAPVNEHGLGVAITRHGYLKAEAFSRLLLSCRAAYTAYSPEHLGKSGLMAAYAVHGLLVVTQGKTPSLPDGLQEGTNVLHEAGLEMLLRPDPNQLSKIGAALRQWYDEHSLEQNARSYAVQIHQSVRGVPGD